MRQEIPRLRRGAALVERDLRATLPGSWSCVVTDDYVLAVVSPHGEERVALDPEVSEDHWLPSELAQMSPQEREATLDDEGIEVIGEEVQEVLRSWGIDWPVCRDHRALLTSCSGVWACSSFVAHDSADIGSLTPHLLSLVESGPSG